MAEQSLIPSVVQRALVAAAGGITAYQRPIDEHQESIAEELRRLAGGDLAPQSRTNLRWYPADVETALRAADDGDLREAARLWSACQHDGIIKGVLSTRTDGLVRLPTIFGGPPRQVGALTRGKQSVGSVFDLLAPPRELAKLAADGIGLGVAVGELVPVPGRSFPVLQRLEPEFLRYKSYEGRWYYRTRGGELPIIPGNGRWVLHLPGGAVNPWRSGVAFAVGEAWIHKTHARSYDNNWQSKLANPARVAFAPQGGTEAQKQSFFRNVMAWGINSVFGLTPGFDVKLLESNGRGSESFDRTIKRSERECIIAIAGQEVTTDGGGGFQNNEIHAQIRADLIQATAAELALTINTQVLLPWVYVNYGMPGLNNPVTVWWDVTPPGDRNALATLLTSLGSGVKVLDDALASHGEQLDLDVIKERFGVVTKSLPETTEVDSRINPMELVAPTQRAAILTVNQLLEQLGFPPNPDIGELTVAEAEALVSAKGQADGQAAGGDGEAETVGETVGEPVGEFVDEPAKEEEPATA